MSEREQFVEDYGVYMEMIYIVLNGDLTRMDEIFKMDAHRLVFLAEYLIRKRKVESKK